MDYQARLPAEEARVLILSNLRQQLLDTSQERSQVQTYASFGSASNPTPFLDKD
jgi:hypothetical protein